MCEIDVCFVDWNAVFIKLANQRLILARRNPRFVKDEIILAQGGGMQIIRQFVNLAS